MLASIIDYKTKIYLPVDPQMMSEEQSGRYELEQQ
jgi:hypothetical protein